MPRPHVLGIRQLDILFPIPSWDIIANESGSIFRSRQRFFDAPADTFAIFRGAIVTPGRYWWTRQELRYQSSRSHPLSFGSLLSWGHLYGGRDAEFGLQVDWRGGGHVILGGTLSRSRVALPLGRFTATLVTGRMEYAFNTRTSFLGFVQYDNEDQRVDFNLRFHWIPRIGDDLFVVWNSGYTTDPTVPHRFPSFRTLGRPLNGAIVVKAAHRFAL